MDRQLFRGAPEAVYLQATYVIGLGWELRAGIRHQFQGWDQVERVAYERLTTEELVQVLLDEVGEGLLNPRSS